MPLIHKKISLQRIKLCLTQQELSSSEELVYLKGAKVNTEFLAEGGQATVGGIGQVVVPGIVLWSQPAAFEVAPDGLGQVQVRAIRRQEKQVRVALLPHGPPLLHDGRRVDAGIVEYEHRWAAGVQGEAVELFDDEGRRDSGRGRGPMALIVAAKQAPAVEAKPFFSRYEHVFIGKLPAVGHVARAAHVGLVAVQERQVTGLRQGFKFGQLRVFGGVADGAGLALYPAADALVAAPKAFKKARNVPRPTAGLPLARWASHSALARAMRCRLACTAARMASSS